MAQAKGQQLDLALLNDVGGLMLQGSLLLFIHCLMVILLYEWLGDFLPCTSMVRLWISATIVLIFDQIGFFAVLNLLFGVSFWAGLSGLIGKLVAAAFCSGLIAIYLRQFEPEKKPAESRHISDVFDILSIDKPYFIGLISSGC